MRSLFSLLALFLGVQSEDEQFIPKGGKTFEQVYGPVGDVDETTRPYERGVTRQALPKSFFERRTQSNCTFPIELYILQDETASFGASFLELKNTQLKKMFDGINAKHPGSKFGVGTHRDIPKFTVGNPDTDYCWQFRLPLTSDWSALDNTFGQLVSTGGADEPEYQFGAIIAAARSQAPGWSDPLAARVLVVSTDAHPHFEGDGFNLPEYHLKPYAGTFDEAHPKEQCKTQYYPSPTQVKTALNRREAYASFMIFDGDLDQRNLPIDAWKWFNSFIGQTPEFVTSVHKGATDFWDKLAAVIAEIERTECVHPSLPQECPGSENCPCPGVQIVLQHKPSQIKLDVNGTQLI